MSISIQTGMPYFSRFVCCCCCC